MSTRDLTAHFVLSALWGGSFLFMRITVPIPVPVLLVTLRVFIARLTLLGFALLTHTLPALRSHRKHFLVIWVVNSASPFVLIATATVHITASLAATLNATTPLFGALIASLWLRKHLTLGKGAGLLLGLVGLIILVGLGPLALTPIVLLSIGASLLGALSYDLAAVYIKRHMTGVLPFALALYSQFFAALAVLPFVPSPCSRLQWGTYCTSD